MNPELRKRLPTWVEMWALDLETSFKEDVSHCILAHHGSLEYGSPVVPYTKEAWIVHLADMASVHVMQDRIS